MKAECTVSIDRPVAEVFSFLERLENHARFVPGLLEFHLVTALGPGAQAVAVRRAFGRVRNLAYRVTTFVPDRAIGLSARLGPLEGSAEYRVEAAREGRTTVTMTSDYRATGPLALMNPILNRMARRDGEAVTQNLKRTIEALPR
jgi:carbon monoxide dehydrogenase subunit G